MRWMLKNSKGQQDAMLTFAVGGFFMTAISIIASFITELKIMSFHTEIGSPDATIVSAFLGATLLAYVNRRNKKDEIDLEMKKLELSVKE